MQHRTRVRAPWEVGHAQPALVQRLQEGRLTGPLLDVGCGTGEFSLLASEQGLDVVGIDQDAARLDRARTQAAAWGLSAVFVQHDAQALAALPSVLAPAGPPDGRFGTVVDSLHLHALGSQSRQLYVAALSTVLVAKGRLVLLSYADDQAGVPHGVSRAAITEVFAGWEVETLDAVRVNTLVHVDGARGWCAVLIAPTWRTAFGTVPTDSPDRYLRQLTDHVGAIAVRPSAAGDAHQGHVESRHALAVTRSERTATVTSSTGTCALIVVSSGLRLELSAASAEGLDALRALLTHRLETIGRRDGLTVQWRS